MLEIRVLGPLEALRDGEPVVLTRPLERRVLAILLVHRRRPISDDQIFEALWQERLPANPAAALQTAVSRLRGILGVSRDELILRSPTGYELEVGAVKIDADRFEELIESQQADSLERALDLWRSDEAYADFRYDDFAAAEAARLEELRLVAWERLLVLRVDADQSELVIPEAELLLKQHPLRERLYEILMLALYQSGRQADALRVFRSARDRLGEELGISPAPALVQLEERILLQDPLLAPTRVAPANNVPSRISSLVGREADISRTARHLHQHRLVTITGSGGIGKTTVGIEAARRVVQEGALQVWMMDLTSLSNSEELAAFLVAKLSSAMQVVPPQGSDEDGLALLIDNLPMLLFLDNCEHIVQPVADLVRHLLQRCPNLTVLATSRERLGIVGEHVAPLDPLELPELGARAHSGEPAPALALFLDRLTAVQPGRVVAETLEAAVDICRRVDGVPLAIELAAARAGALTVPDVARQLNDTFAALGEQRGVADRHASIRAAMAWSYDLLDESQRRHLTLTSTMNGPFSIRDAAQLFGYEREVDAANALSDLQEKSLVQSDLSATPTTRFELLSPVREFGRRQARLESRWEDHLDRHASSMRDLAARAREEVTGSPQQLNWMNRISESLPDFRQAVETLVARDDPAAALDIVAGIGWYFAASRRTTEGYDLAQMAFDAAGSDVYPATAAAELAAAIVMLVSGGRAKNLDVGAMHLDRAAAAAATTGDDQTAVETEVYEGFRLWYVGQPDEAEVSLVAALARAERDGHLRAARLAALALGLICNALQPGSPDVRRKFEQALEIARRESDSVVEAHALSYLGALAREEGDYAASAVAYHESLLIASRFGFPMLRTVSSAGLAMALWMDGWREEALVEANRARRMARRQPGSEALRSYQQLFIDTHLDMPEYELRDRMAEVLGPHGDQRPELVLMLLFDVYEAVAKRRLTAARADEIDAFRREAATWQGPSAGN